VHASAGLGLPVSARGGKRIGLADRHDRRVQGLDLELGAFSRLLARHAILRHRVQMLSQATARYCSASNQTASLTLEPLMTTSNGETSPVSFAIRHVSSLAVPTTGLNCSHMLSGSRVAVLFSSRTATSSLNPALSASITGARRGSDTH